MKRFESPEHLAKVHALPCICCKLDGTEQITPTQAHHIRRQLDGSTYGKSQKAHDYETIPLCSAHHWNGVGSTITHIEFENRYGNERFLLAQTYFLLSIGELAS